MMITYHRLQLFLVLITSHVPLTLFIDVTYATYSIHWRHICHLLHFEGANYSEKFRGKRGFPNLANSKTSQFMFPKYL